MDVDGRKAWRAGRGISGSGLKLIAVFSMLIDHLGVGIIEMGVLCSYDGNKLRAILNTEAGMIWYMADRVMRGIGRLAFPIFCFLLVEGFLHTRNEKRYVERMFLFALISELPFDLVVTGHWDLWNQNVFFTLAIGLLVLWGLKLYERSWLGQSLAVILGCLAALALRTDYDAFGILLIAGYYLFRQRPMRQFVYGAVMMALETTSLFGCGALAAIPIYCYDGQRGRLRWKYAFYWFYPMHLAAVYVIRTFVLRL